MSPSSFYIYVMRAIRSLCIVALFLCSGLLCSGQVYAVTAGNLDTSFNTGTGANSFVYNAALQSDNKIVIAGDFSSINGIARSKIARLDSDGSLDTSFSPGSGANGSIVAIAIQVDGRIIVGGYFTSYNGVARNYIARLNNNGSLDTTFNTSASYSITDIVLQNDGKIIVGGGFTSINGVAHNYIARLNNDGSLDTTFNTSASSSISAIAVQSDNKIIIGGQFTNINSVAQPYIARLNNDGSLDGSFNLGTGPNDSVSSIAVQNDGKIIIIGSFGSVNSTVRNSIARLNSDGSLDNSFNAIIGRYTLASVALQDDGKIIVGGSFTSVNGIAKFRIARLNTDSTVDNTFDPGSGANSTIYSIQMQNDGKIVFGAAATTYNGTTINYLARLHGTDFTDYDSDSVLDSADNCPLVVNVSQLDTDGDGHGDVCDVFPNDVAEWDDSDGDGVGDNGDNCPITSNSNQADIDSDTIGDVCDTDSDGDGISNNADAFPLNNAASVDTDLDGMPDSWLVASGCVVDAVNCGGLTLDDDNDNDNVLNAIDPRPLLPGDHYLDLTFNGSGYVTSGAYQVVQQLDEKLVAVGYYGSGGYFNDGVSLKRYNLDGSPDASFNGTGLVNIVLGVQNPSGGSYLNNIVQRQNGTLTAVGEECSNIFYNYMDNSQYGCGGYNAVSVDVSDSGSSLGMPSLAGTYSSALDAVSQNDNKLVVIRTVCTQVYNPPGHSKPYCISSNQRLTRYNTNYSVDFDVLMSIQYPTTLIQQQDGKFVVAGYDSNGSNVDFSLTRYNSNGSLDASFNGSGSVTTAVGAFDDQIKFIMQQVDGKLVAVGYSCLVSSCQSKTIAVVRYNPDGSLDASFNGNGVVTTSIGANAYGTSVIQQDDGRLVVAGAGTVNSQQVAIVRYNTDGSLDTIFGKNGVTMIALATGNQGDASSLIKQLDGKLVFVNNGSIVRIDIRDGDADGAFDNMDNCPFVINANQQDNDGDGYGDACDAFPNNATEWSDADNDGMGDNGDNCPSLANVDQLDNDNDNHGDVCDTFPNNSAEWKNSDGDSIGDNADNCPLIININQLDTDGDGVGDVCDNAPTTPNPNQLDSDHDGIGDVADNCPLLASANQADADGDVHGDLCDVFPNNPAEWADTDGDGLGDNADHRQMLIGDRYLDYTFNSDGYAVTPVGVGTAIGRATIQQQDGKLVVAGYASNGSDDDFAITRYNSDGTLDSGFNGSGKVITAIGSGADHAYSVIQQQDGKLVVAGYSYNGSNYDFALVRYNSDGSLDSGFNGSGILTTAIGSLDDVAYSVIQQADGKLVAGGYSATSNAGNYFTLVRYNNDGALDTNFNVTGKFSYSMQLYPLDSGSIYSVIQQQDGKLVAAGNTSNPFESVFGLLRLNIDGSMDTSFNATGKYIQYCGSNCNNVGRSIIQQADGKLVVAGHNFNGGQFPTPVTFSLARFTTTGVLEFIKYTAIGTNDSYGYSVVQQSDNKLMVAGTSSNNIALLRFDTNGLLDTTFGKSGKELISIATGSNDVAYSLIRQFNDAYVLAGNYDNEFLIVRLAFDADADGLKDYLDNCTNIYNPGQLDTDGDGYGDACDNDDDNDGVADGADTFPLDVAESVDSDNDGTGNNADTDDDNDGIADASDNCPISYGLSTNQVDTDGDAQGDVCDSDDDNDGVADGADTFPLDAAESVDSDNDGTGNNADTDDDNDGIADGTDNCPISYGLSTSQVDTDGDTQGDVCDSDDDGDGVADISDNCPLSFGLGSSQLNTDGDASGNVCDADDDNDGIADGSDNCPISYGLSTSQVDTDGDTQGDVCDSDDDGDGVADISDNCPLSFGLGSSQLNTDGDASGNVCDADDDNDGVADSSDLRPLLVGDRYLDPAFNSVGYAITDMASGGTTDSGRAVVQQDDGKLVVAGYTVTNTNNNNFALVRYNSNGTLDTTFGGTGKVITALSAFNDEAYGVLQQADGKLVAVGRTCNGGTCADYNVVAVRYNSDGTLDSSFGVAGKASFDTHANAWTEQLNAVVQQPDGKLLAAGYTCVVGNSSSCSNYDFLVIRINSNGTLDSSFGSGGKVITPIGSASDYGQAMRLLADGRFVVAGYTLTSSNNNDFALVRYNSNGMLDTTFGTNGKALTSMGVVNDMAYALLQQADGKIVAAGTSNNDIAIVRYNTDGTLDTGFDTDGKVVTAVGADIDVAYSTVQQADGKILVVGYSYTNPTNGNDIVLLRYNGDGSLDTGFGNNGTELINIASGSNDIAYAAIQLIDGALVLAGSTGNDFLVARLLTNNDIDNDTIGNNADNCPSIANANQLDSDIDGHGDVCDAFPNDAAEWNDTDSDTLGDNADNCPSIANTDQLNTDGDAQGNACDSDDDNDGVADGSDAFPLDANESTDTDSDTIGNNSDNCVSVSNVNQLNTDGDAQGNACDSDDDNDGVADTNDVFPLDANESADADNDGTGNNADTDDDNDGVVDASDAFPFNASESADSDGDGVGNNADAFPNDATETVDTDSDGTGDNSDNCVFVSNADQLNTDGDALGNACDPSPTGEADSDGVPDNSDNCPAVNNADQLDADGNGIGDACDVNTNGNNNGTAKTDASGSAVVLADMNNDGYADIIIGSPLADVVINSVLVKDAGRIQIISGADGSTVLHSFDGVAAKEQFGTAIAIAPDQDSDGTPDLLVGSPLADPLVSGVVQKDAGTVSLYSGANGAFIQRVASGAKAGDHFGAALAVGDVNNDAQVDLVVGAPLVDVLLPVIMKDAGQVTVFNGISNSVLYTRDGTQAKELFGSAVAVNTVDHRLLIGSPGFDVLLPVKQMDAGRVQIFDATDITASSAEVFGQPGAAKGDRFGAALACFNQDMDGDTNVDWAVGIPGADTIDPITLKAIKDIGKLQIFSGTNTNYSSEYTGAAAGDNFGAALNASGDINNDTLNDMVVGSPKFDPSTLQKDAGHVEVLSGAALH